MSSIIIGANLSCRSFAVLDERCAGNSRDTSSIVEVASGLLRYETNLNRWIYYKDSTAGWVTLSSNISNAISLQAGLGISISPSNQISLDSAADVSFNSVTHTNSLIELANSNTSTSSHIGFYGTYADSSNNTKYAGFIFDGNVFKPFYNASNKPSSSSVNFSGSLIPTINSNINGQVSSITNHNLTSLGDVNIQNTVAFKHLLVYSPSGNWENAAIDTSYVAEDSSRLYYTDARVDTRINSASINDLNDVDTTSVSNGQILKYNTTNSRWEVANETGTTYAQGNGISINTSNVISIDQTFSLNLTNLTSITRGTTDNSTNVATTAFVQTAISNLIDSAPSTLDTLNELAAALNDDANFSTTITNSLATKLPISDFTSHPSYTITSNNITNWNTAYGWGDHTTQGYLTSFTETDPIFSASAAYSIATNDITNWNTAYGWGDHSIQGYLTSFTETDPIFSASAAYSIATNDITNWNTAYSWGDHSIQGYLTSVDIEGYLTSVDIEGYLTSVDIANVLVDTDFTSSGLMATDGSGTYSIVTDNSTNWNTAYSWGDHSIQGYLTSVDIEGYLTSVDIDGYLTSVDIANVLSNEDFTSSGIMATDGSGTYSIVTDNSTNWNTAYSWGDHSIQGYLTSVDIEGYLTSVDIEGYLTSVDIANVLVDTDFTSSGLMATDGSGTYSIVTDNSTNWNTAYSWGDHSIQGYLTSVDIEGYLTSVDIEGYLTSVDIANVLVDTDFTSSGIMATDGSGTYSIVTDNSTNWNTAYSWGDHSIQGYLTSVDIEGYLTSVDIANVLSNEDFTSSGIMATDGSGTYSIVTDNSTNWNTAYSWGDHSIQGYLTSVDIEGYLTSVDIEGYLTSVDIANVLVDTDFTTPGIMATDGSGTYSIVTDNSTNWNTAYSWGDHSIQGYLTSVDIEGYLTSVDIEGYLTSVDIANVLVDTDFTTPGIMATDGSGTYSIVTDNSTNWNTAYSWGDHSTQGYLTSTDIADVLLDGDFTTAGIMATDGSGTYSIITDNSGNWNTAYGWGDHSTQGYLTSASIGNVLLDGDFTTAGIMATDGSGTYSIITDNSGNWNTAYGWGDHSTQGYLTSTDIADVLLDGDFTTAGIMATDGSGTYSIITDNSGNWNTAYGWGDHSTQGYLTSASIGNVLLDGDFTTAGIMATDGSGTYSIITDNSGNWNTAYGWGDHSIQGYLTSVDIEGYLTSVDIEGYLTSVDIANVLSNEDFTSSGLMATDGSGTYSIVTDNSTNWNTAYSWGDHSIQGYLTSVDIEGYLTSVDIEGYLTSVDIANVLVDTDFTSSGLMATDGSGTYSIVTDNSTNWNTAYSWGDHSIQGYLTSTDIADVLLDGDFTTAGIMATDGSGTYSIITDNSGNWNTAYGWGDHSTQGYLTSASIGNVLLDGDFTTAGIMATDGSGTYSIITDNSGNWNTAYGWGDHSTQGYLTSTDIADVLLDGDFTTAGIMATDGSGTYSIITDNSGNWNTAYGWGDHSTQGYLTSASIGNVLLDGDFTTAGIMATDGSGTYSIITDNSGNWNTAYGWGDHSIQGYLTSVDIEGYLTSVDIEGYLTSVDIANVLSNEDFTSSGLMATDGSGTYSIVTDNSTNWNTAYSWGDHSIQGYLTSVDIEGYLTSVDIEGYLTSVDIANVLVDTDFTTPGIMATDGSGTYSIVTDNSTNWNTAYSWGDHSIQGYLTSTDIADVLLDGDFTTAGIMATDGSGTYSIITDNSGNWNTAYGWGDHSTQGYLTSASIGNVLLDGDFTTAGIMATDGSGTYSIITDNSGNWNTAYGWGDHSTQGYLTSTDIADVLLDGDFTTAGIMATDGSGTYSIITDNSGNWNTAYGWGDHSTQGYLTSASIGNVLLDGDFTTAGIMATDGSGTYSIITDNSGNWNTAYGWGDHSIQGYLTSVDIEGYLTSVDIEGYLTSVDIANVLSNEDFTTPGLMATDGSGTYSIVTDNSTNWNTAYSWGDHSIQGYLTSVDIEGYLTSVDIEGYLTSVDIANVLVDTDFTSSGLMATDGSGTYSIVTDNSTNWNTAYSWGDHSIQGYLTSVDIEGYLTSVDIEGYLTSVDIANVLVDTDFTSSGIMATDGSGTYSIVTDNSTNWNTAYSWGDHSIQGYLTSVDIEGYLTSVDIEGYLTSVDIANVLVDTDFTTPGIMATDGSGTYSIVTDNSTNWNTAYSWGDHSIQGYLTSVDIEGYLTSVDIEGYLTSVDIANVLVDTDFTTPGIMATDGSGTYSIVTDNSTNWNTAYSWGDHSTQGYLTSTDIADVLLDGDFTTAGIMATDGSGTYSIITDNSGNWNTAYGWGDHSTQGYLTSASIGNVLLDGDFTTAGIMATDGSGTYSIITDNSGNWNTAYGWGDHSTQGYLTSTDIADVLLDGDFTTAGIMATDGSGTYSIITDNSGNWNTAYGWGDHSTQGYLTSASIGNVLLDGDFTTAGIMATDGSGTYSIITDNSGNWNTAYGWGDHSTQGYLTSSSSINDLADVNISGTSSGHFLYHNGTNWENLAATLTDLNDVIISTLNNGDILRYNSVSQRWETDTFNIDDLDNVNIVGVANNEVLKYNSVTSKWENSNRIDTLDELGDVTLTSVTTGDLLRYNGSIFVNTKIALDNDFTNVNFTSLTNGDLIKYDGSNFINFSPTYLDGAGISDNYLIKVVSGATTQTTFIETSALNTSTSLKTYIPLSPPFPSVLAGSIETEIFNTNKTRMHLTSTGIANAGGITITSDGRVGIGVVEPEEDLELDGNIQLDTGGVQRGRIIFYDKQNNHEHAEIDGLGEGTNGGVLAFYTKVDGVSVTEKLRINNQGAIGIKGAFFGNSGQVIVSRGSGAPVEWADQTDTTYTNGTGVNLVGTTFSIGQPVATSDSVTFKSLNILKDYVGLTIDPIINFTDNNNGGTLAYIQMLGDGVGAGQLQFFTKRRSGVLEESLTIKQYGGTIIKTDFVGLQINSQDGVTEQGYIYNSSVSATKDFTIDAAVGSSTKGILFRTNSGQDRMRIGHDGNVGIGTITPTHRLEVNGDIKGDNLFLGENEQTPKIDMMFKQVSPGWDTRITIGVVEDFPNTTSYPAYPPAGSMGINIERESDGLFIGIENYSSDSGDYYRPLLKWGDNQDDTPFTIHSHYGGHKWEFHTDGRLLVKKLDVNSEVRVFNQDNTTTHFNHDSGTGSENYIRGSVLEIATGIFYSINNGVFNNARVGDMGYGSDYVGLAHNSLSQPNNYAILQQNDGSTFINASPGKAIYFRINNVTDVAKIDTDALQVSLGKFYLNGVLHRGYSSNSYQILPEGYWSSSTWTKPEFTLNQYQCMFRVLDSNNAEITKLQCYHDGHIYYTGQLTFTSDDRLKSYETDVSNATDMISKLNPKFYKKHPTLITDDPEPDLSGVLNFDEYGFIAQELNEDPQLSHFVKKNSDTDIYHVNYIEMIPLLVQTIKELNERIKVLESRL